MCKKRMSFHEFKILIVICFSILIISCNGQVSNNKVRSESLDTKTEALHSTIEKKSSIVQISEVVRMMYQDSKGNIWFGAQGGAFKYSNNSLIHIDSIKSETGKKVTIKDIVEDNTGKIWIGHTDGISSVEGEKVTNYYESDGLISNDVWCIETDVNNHLWIGTIEGVCRFNGQEFINFELPEGKIDSTLGISSTKMVHSIMEDSKGEIWFSTNAGLFRYKDNVLINVSKEVGIKTNFINEIVEIKKNEYWISTKEALYKMEGNRIENITAEIPEVGKGVGSIEEDVSGNIWFVFNQHYLYKYDGKNLSEFKKSDDNKGPVVFQIYKDQDDRLWFVGYGGAFRLENEKFINITNNGPW